MSNSIVEQPEWQILDSSKIDDYILCGRYFFFRHILGWRPDAPAHDLHFGVSWHKAREYQLANGYDDIEGAYLAFETEYRKEFPPETDTIYIPKTPAAVLAALLRFRDEYSNDLVENEVVVLDNKQMLEISGTVPITENRVLHYRMDNIMRRKSNERIFSWDHKSTSENYLNSRQWADSFQLSVQNGTYTHCLYCMFPIDLVDGVEFCGTGFAYLKRNSKNRTAGYHASLRRVPAFKRPDQMNVWLHNTLMWIDEMDRDMNRLASCKPGDPVLACYKQNPKSCTAYRGCPYHEYCMAWENPLRRCEEPPLGFVQEFWDPSTKEANVTKNLELPKC